MLIELVSVNITKIFTSVLQMVLKYSYLCDKHFTNLVISLAGKNSVHSLSGLEVGILFTAPRIACKFHILFIHSMLLVLITQLKRCFSETQTTFQYISPFQREQSLWNIRFYLLSCCFR